jgi:hypothetical protein
MVPSDPVASALAQIDKICKTINDNPVPFKNDYENVAAMLQTVFIVRAIDRLTAAVKENTRAVLWLGPTSKPVDPD